MVSLVYSVTPRVIEHKHEAHVIVLINKMGESYKNTKFEDMENVTDIFSQAVSFPDLISFCLFL